MTPDCILKMITKKTTVGNLKFGTMGYVMKTELDGPEIITPSLKTHDRKNWRRICKKTNDSIYEWNDQEEMMKIEKVFPTKLDAQIEFYLQKKNKLKIELEKCTTAIKKLKNEKERNLDVKIWR